MPIHLQTRLLRVLQEKEVMRLGGDSIIDVDVRYAGLEQALTDSAEKTAPAIPDAFLQERNLRQC